MNAALSTLASFESGSGLKTAPYHAYQTHSEEGRSNGHPYVVANGNKYKVNPQWKADM